MKLKSIPLALSLVASSLLYAKDSDEFMIQLKDPQYSKGVVKTDHGGVIIAPSLRIQAQRIEYINTTVDDQPVQQILAEGDLMMEYQERIFVGEKLVFDLLTKTGYLLCGRSGVGSWFLGGDCLELCEDKNLLIHGGFITTSVSASNPWEIRSEKILVEKGYLLTAKDVRFQVLKTPIFWLPGYKSNLKRFKDPPIRYRVIWDKGLGPRLSMRYRFYSTENFNAFARFDYRIIRGPGGALEGEYLSKDKRTSFQTRNYGALDKVFPNEKGDVRFRFQGLLKSRSKDERTRLHLQWDRLSDDRMVSEFRSPDFEINTQKATYLEFSHYDRNSFGELSVHPKINPFQSLNQELPYGALGIRPLHIWKTGIISENYANGSYLDYTYANQLDEILPNRKAGRLETLNSLYRPFSLGSFTLVPRVGLVGIFYSDSPDKNATGQLLYTYGGDFNTRFSKQFSSVKHSIEPYVSYLGYTRPQTPVDEYFVFDIHDGYDRLDQLRFGLRQLFFTRNSPIFAPRISLDLYSYAFWGARSFDQRIPKVFADLSINQRTTALHGGLGWNLQENVLDYGNIRFLWTVNAALAFTVEFRHRSRYYWRKAIHDNFVVDFARPLDELLESPLSDQRNTLLTQAHIRLSPRWNLQLQTHHGWGRPDEPRYNGAKVDFYTMITGSWQMKLTYEYMRNDPFRVSYNFKLIK